MGQGYDRIAKAEDDAKAKGCVIVLPGVREAFVDIDSLDAYAVFDKHAVKLAEVLPFTYVRRPSPSGRDGHFHVTCTFERDLTPVERITIQAVLGSDLMRELLSFRRYVTGDAAPTLFFEKPGDEG
jgi:hypothetical protein